MPIKGLTDIHQFGAGLPRLGTLYKGDEKGANKPGPDLKHFRFEPEPQFEYLAPLWQELYSTEPTEFSPVFLFGNTADEAFETWMEEWSASGLQHRCDGEMQTRWYDRSIGEYSVARIACDSMKGCQCKRTGRLRLVFPDFVELAGVMGYIAMTTHSIHDILTLHRYLADIARMYGKLEGVPFVFGRAAREVSAPKQNDTAKRIKTTKSLLYMHVLPDFTREQLVSRIAPQEGQAQLPDKVVTEDGELVRVARKPSVRRMGGGEDDGLPEWWTALLDWADDQFSFDEGLVRLALKLTDGRWKEEKRVAMAAVIASHCKYDVMCIDQYTSANGNAFETFAAALEVVEAYKARHGDEVVP